jgi:hypothetical protein
MNENRLRPDQIQALVDLDKAGGGQSDPDEVDRIFEINKVKEEVVDDEPEWLSGEPTTAPVDVSKAPEPTVEATKPEVKLEQPKVIEKPAEVKPAVVVNGADVSASGFDDLWS